MRRRLLRALAGLGGRVDLVSAIGPATALRHRRLAARFWASPPHDAVNAAIWSEAADELGAEVVERGGGILEIRLAGRTTRVWNHVTMLDDPVTLRVALDRALVHELLRSAGVAVPEHLEFSATRPAPALAFVRERVGPFVVKPAGGTSGGHGVTCAVRDRADLLRACLAAACFDERLIAERHAGGDMYRLLFLDGELLGAVRRRPPCVVGDGRSTLAELVAAENRRRLDAVGSAGVVLIRPDLDLVLTLRHQGLTPRSVPPAGATVVVKTATSENGPADNVVVDAKPTDGAVREALAAVAPIGLRLAGVDLVTTDLGSSLSAAGGAVIEVNGTPGLHYHYLVADPGRVIQVAVPLLRRLLEHPVPGPGIGLED